MITENVLTGAGLRVGARLLDGAEGATFIPRCLQVRTYSPPPPTAAIWPASAGGQVTLQLTGGGGSYGLVVRRFQLGLFEAVRLDVRGWRMIGMELLQTNLPPAWNLSAMLTDEDPPQNAPPLLYTQTNTQAGAYAVPPGAVALRPATPDAGFAWLSDDSLGVPVVLPAPALPGQEVPVSGSRFSTTVANFAGVWRIQP